MKQAQIGVFGLGVMGASLALNLADHGFVTAVCNREEEPGLVDAFSARAGERKELIAARTLTEFVHLLERPRKVLLMIASGKPVDDMVDRLQYLLQPGDIIIDGGNSHYEDTNRRVQMCEKAGLSYIGLGVSGGEKGALEGPSLMPGGTVAAWTCLEPIFTAIAAKAPEPCCRWIGPQGAGHFVKMVHNGIEYGMMQLICESYDLMRAMGMSCHEIGLQFGEWNRGRLSGYLIEVCRDVLLYSDEEGRSPLEYISDIAGQKGTGKWTCQAAFDLGVPADIISQAVYARILSGDAAARAAARQTAPPDLTGENPEELLCQIEEGLYMAVVLAYAQGFALLDKASRTWRWDLRLDEIANLWRGGCIIRAGVLTSIAQALAEGAPHLITAPMFAGGFAALHPSLRRLICRGAMAGVPLPAFSAALAYYDGAGSANLPTALIQAMRDYFGAHTFERRDKPGQAFHIQWDSIS